MSNGFTRGIGGSGIVACAALLGCAGGDTAGGPERVGQAAQAVGNVTLSIAAAPGTGAAQFTTDEFGATDPCCGTGTGMLYDPTGVGTLGSNPQETSCNTFLEVIEPGASTRALLTTCSAGPQPVTLPGDVDVVDALGTTRHTTFSLPSVPGINVDLVQTAVSTVQLDQTYTFLNTTTTSRNLVMVFFHDMDLLYSGGVFDPNGWQKNRGRKGPTPTSVTIMDDKRKVRVTLSSALGPSTTGVAGGYRVAQFAGDNETEDFEAPGTTGIAAGHLNGIFYTSGVAPGDTSFSNEGPGDVNGDGLTDCTAPTTGLSQWSITVPAGLTATLVTSTVFASGTDTKNYVNFGCTAKAFVGRAGNPGTVTDTQLASNAGLQTFGAASVMNSGQVGAGQRNALVQFDVNRIPQYVTIDAATLTLTVRAGYAANATVNAHPVLVPWSDATETWSSFYAQPAPQYGPILSSVITTPQTSGPVVWDVTALVAAWVVGAQPNNGILIEQGAGSTSYWTSEAANVAQRPTLNVRYE
jgi:hypothetical protein